MCGIVGVGIADLSTSGIQLLLKQMTDAIIHRGPDDEGFFTAEGIGLGMRRLSIIDLEGGRQPIHNEDETIQVVFNGEIYNYLQLKNDLETLGHRFYTKSDTEVIVHAYEQYGENFVSKLRGMFGIALWDARNRVLFLAVDRFGIKPMYYSCDEKGIIFGSELKSLLVTNRVSRSANDEALAQFFTFGYIPAPYSIFQNVKKLPPGHFLRWTPENACSIDLYWDLNDVPASNLRNTVDIHIQLYDVLKDAVRSHLVSDVPLGAFLSGGVDSSTVVALMSEVSAGPVETFSIGFANREHNELKYARLVAERFSTRHHELTIEPQTVDILPDLVAHFDEPFADSSGLPTYCVSQMARQSVKVALSGDGGDELFVGYTLFQGVELARYVQLLPAVLRNAGWAATGRLLNSNKFSRNDHFKATLKRVSDSLLPPLEAYHRKKTMLGLDSIGPLLSDSFRRQLLIYDPYKPFDEQLARYIVQHEGRIHPLEPFLYAGLKVSLPGDMLVKVDRMSMANSLEVRVPLLDHVLAEFVAALPVNQRFPRWRLKGLLKDTMAKILPSEVLNHPKHGFTVPLTAWFRDDLAGFAAEVLSNGESRKRGYLNEQAVDTMLKQRLYHTHNFGTVLWSLLVFELWLSKICAASPCAF